MFHFFLIQAMTAPVVTVNKKRSKRPVVIAMDEDVEDSEADDEEDLPSGESDIADLENIGDTQKEHEEPDEHSDSDNGYVCDNLWVF